MDSEQAVDDGRPTKAEFKVALLECQKITELLLAFNVSETAMAMLAAGITRLYLEQWPRAEAWLAEFAAVPRGDGPAKEKFLAALRDP